ncbi:MAG: hypothetical protein ACRCXZ_10065 [Patescibacteria group bacterium]
MNLILNIGSTSTKYSVFDGESEASRGATSNIQEIIDKYLPKSIIIRIVFGGVNPNPIKVNDLNLEELEKYNSFAPLHNPYAINKLKELRTQNEKLDFYCVFDNWYFRNLPEIETLIPLSPKIRKDHPEIRNYGFHGFSHDYLVDQYSKQYGIKKPNLITCHLGGGSSITAIKRGVPIATSMGFGPEEGLVMVKRVGDVGPNVILKLIESGMSVVDIRDEIFKNSGLKAIAGTEDVKMIFENQSIESNKLAFELFLERMVDFIGTYYLKLNMEVDAIILAGGIGEKSTILYNSLNKKLAKLNIPLIIIPTNEEEKILKIIKMYFTLK